MAELPASETKPVPLPSVGARGVMERDAGGRGVFQSSTRADNEEPTPPPPPKALFKPDLEKIKLRVRI